MAEKEDNLKHKILGSLPEDRPVTEDKNKQVLIQRFRSHSANEDLMEILRSLLCFYNDIKRNDLATSLIKILMDMRSNSERQAACFLSLGQIMEQEGRFDFAARFYREGLCLSPKNKTTAYFLHNNLGDCLNLQGAYIEAEQLCRKAIEIDSTRANAFKNLGISLAGQNDLIGAAWVLIEAIRTDATDPRAFQLLQVLIKDHTEVAAQFYGVLKQLEDCKKAELQ